MKAIKTERCVGKIKKEDVIWKLKMEGLIVGTFCIIGLVQIIIAF